MSLRKVIFWLHLGAGVTAGLVILVMSATGVALAFEKEIIAFAERDTRRIIPPPEARQIPIDELLAKVREAQPRFKPSAVTIDFDPAIAVLVSTGRTNGFYVNQYTGAVHPQGAKKTRSVLQTALEWHRYLGTRDDKRPIGKAITGACNVAFCFLAITGLYLWWPRQWTKASLRAIVVVNWSLRGKARDWNWHNVIGFWCGAVLAVLTATAMPISYRWATTVIYKLTRTQPPPPAAAPVEIPQPAAGTGSLTYQSLLTRVQGQAPHWRQVTLRLGGEGRRTGVTFAVKQRDGSPRFATAQFTLNPFTGDVLRADQYSDYNLGRRVRTWTRFLHTGEALGPIGQFVAGAASMGGVFLVYTGLALALRRFLRRKTVAQRLPVETLSSMP